jgi:putative lipase involved disintegration of autophagic bodies
MKTLLTLIIIFSLSGCAYSISDINTANSDPVCVRECAATYSSCVSGGPQIGAKTETLRACRESYSVCISTCPPK